jgi:hypothetical protein
MLKRFVTSTHACPSLGLLATISCLWIETQILATVGEEAHHGLETVTRKHVLARDRVMRSSC